MMLVGSVTWPSASGGLGPRGFTLNFFLVFWSNISILAPFLHPSSLNLLDVRFALLLGLLAIDFLIRSAVFIIVSSGITKEVLFSTFFPPF